MGLFKVALLVVLLLQVASLGVYGKVETSKKLAVSEAPVKGGKGLVEKSEVKQADKGKSSAPANADESAKKSDAAPNAAGSKVLGAPEGPKKSVVPGGDNGPAK
eukprot:Tbor_TRINITY_DN6188_c3_g1::TRINITY_DN6188_c3_g1_i8::g.22245::m.22245